MRVLGLIRFHGNYVGSDVLNGNAIIVKSSALLRCFPFVSLLLALECAATLVNTAIFTSDFHYKCIVLLRVSHAFGPINSSS